jgi:hypothetical protein
MSVRSSSLHSDVWTYLSVTESLGILEDLAVTQNTDPHALRNTKYPGQELLVSIRRSCSVSEPQKAADHQQRRLRKDNESHGSTSVRRMRKRLPARPTSALLQNGPTF